MIWGGEAVAVRHDGRANPNQLVANEHTLAGLAQLREALVNEHAATFGNAGDLLIGLQLTHSGRFARPNDKKRLEPMTLYRHPLLDRKFHVPRERGAERRRGLAHHRRLRRRQRHRATRRL